MATFSYAGSPYCANAANPSPTFSGGGVAGTFSSTAGLNFVSTATGQVNLATSTPGTYTVTNTIAASGGCAQVTATSSITITALPVATFSYTGTPYCSNAANPSPIFSGGGVAGTFSSTAGLNFVSTATGQINLATSTPGTYTVTNTIAAAGGCGAVVATSSITITALPVATFSYTGTPYCQNAANPSPTFSGGGVAGTFTAPAGLSINAATGVVNLAASTPGTYTVTNTIAASGGCGAVVATSSITVTALPAATFSYTGTPYCQNAANPSPTFSGGGVAGTFTAPAGLSINAATGVVNLAASTPGTYTVTNTIAAANGCGVVTATSQITITKLPVATFSYTGTPYCKNAANPSPTYSGGGVAGTFSASPAGLNFVSTATGQINLATSTPGTYTVTNTIAASGGCAQVTATSSVTITAVPVATFSYTGTPYCSNAANPSPTFSGGGVAGTFSSTAGLVFVSTATGQVNLATSTPGTYTVTNTIAAANGCGVVTATSQITITKLPVATFSYTGTPYCKNAANPSPTYSGGGVAGTFSASPAGLNFVSTATGQINLATSTPGTYTVTNTIAASGGCAQVTATSSVTITAVPVATFSYTGTPYCSNAANPSPTFSGGGVAGTFSSTAGLVFVSTATGQVNLATSTAGTYTVTNTIAAANGCGVVTATSNIVINTAPSISGQPTDQTTCAGTAKTFSVTATGTSRTYQWQYSPDNVGWTNVANGTPANITYANTTTATLTVTPAAAAANGTYYYRCVVSVSGCSSINSNSATLTVSATPTTANAGADQTICTTTASVTLAANTPAAGKGTGTWSVVSGPNTSLTQFSNINSPTATFTPAGGAGTYVLRWTISNGACTASTDNVNIIVNAAPVINSQPNNQTTCAGTAKTFGVTLSAGTSPTYQWQYSPNNVAWSNVANGTPANITYGGATGATLTVTPSAAAASGTYYYRCIVSVNGCSAVTSNFATLTVNINATITLTSAAGTNAQTVCQNTPIINITYAIGGSGTGASITSGSFPAGVAGNYSAGVFTISGTPTAAGTFNYTITAMGQCTQGTASGTITVTAGPTGAFTATETSGTANNDNIICTGAAVIFTAPSGYGAYTFYVNGIKVQGPNTSNTYSTSTLNNGDQVTVDVANAANCGATFGPITITVNPLPTATLVADKNPVCAGDLVTFTATGGTGYNFKVNGLSRQSGASATFATTTLANNDAVTVDATNANGCIATSPAVFMTVNPLPTGTLTASSATICAGDNVTFTATAGAATYEFKVDGVTVQGPSASNTYSSTALTNGQVVTVIATSAASCSKTFNPVLINVNAVPTGTLTVTENSGTPNDNTICANAPVTFTFTAGFSNYNFKVNGVSQQNGASRTYVNTTLITGDVVTVEVTNGSSCKATFTAPAITIVPSPAGTLTVSPSATICAGDNVTFTATTGYTSYNFKIGGSSVQVGAGNTFSTTTLANGNVVTVDVTNSNGCISTFGPVTMTVNPLPTGTMTPVENSGLTPDDGIICTGATVVFTAPTGFTNYDFILNGATVQSGASRTYTNSTLANGDVVKVAVTNGSSCIGLLNTITITVNPLPVVAPITGTLSVCVGATTTLSSTTTGGTWASLATGIATVDPSTGVVTGVAAGTATITYTFTNANGCSTTISADVVVNPLPVVAAITGNLNICTGTDSQLDDVTPGGTWGSSNTAVATVIASGANAGLVSGVGPGNSIISYMVTDGNGCTKTVTATVTVTLHSDCCADNHYSTFL